MDYAVAMPRLGGGGPHVPKTTVLRGWGVHRRLLTVLIAIVLVGSIEDDHGCDDSHPKGSDFPSSPTTPSTYTYTYTQTQLR